MRSQTARTDGYIAFPYLKGEKTMDFLHVDKCDEHISLHDCIATGAYFREGKLGFEFENGFWVLSSHPENSLGETVRTDFSRVEYDLDEGQDFDATVYVFDDVDGYKSMRTYIPIQRFVDDINSGKYRLEFLYQYLGYGARIMECELIFDSVPYRKECEIKICADEVSYCWNNMREDAPW